MAQFSCTHTPPTPNCSPRGPKRRPSQPVSVPNPSDFLVSIVTSARQLSSCGLRLPLARPTGTSEEISAAGSPSVVPPQRPHLFIMHRFRQSPAKITNVALTERNASPVKAVSSLYTSQCRDTILQTTH
jgi:hypothetical protein